MFVVTASFSLTAGASGAFMPHMIVNRRTSLEVEPGCHHFDICTDPERPDHVYLYEIYDDAAAFEAHRQTPHFNAFMAQVSDMVQGVEVVTYPQLDR